MIFRANASFTCFVIYSTPDLYVVCALRRDTPEKIGDFLGIKTQDWRILLLATINQKSERKSKMQDRGSAGAVSGMAAAVIQIVYGFIVKGLGLTDRSFTEFAKVFLMYRNYSGIAAFIVGFITQVLIGAVLGMVFASFIEGISKRFYYLKGLGFGAVF
jgi:hypothetical protein